MPSAGVAASSRRKAGGVAALGGGQEGRAERGATCPKRERRGDPAAVHDPARGEHGHRDGVDHLRHEHEAPDLHFGRRELEGAAMPARLPALRDHDVDAGSFERPRLGHGRRRPDDRRAGRLHLGEVRDPEREAEHRHLLLDDDGELLVQRGVRVRRSVGLRPGEEVDHERPSVSCRTARIAARRSAGAATPRPASRAHRRSRPRPRARGSWSRTSAPAGAGSGRRGHGLRASRTRPSQA